MHFKGTKNERSIYMSNISRKIRRCYSAGKSIRKLSLLYMAMHEETMSLAETEYERSQFTGYKKLAEDILLEDGESNSGPTRVENAKPNLE